MAPRKSQTGSHSMYPDLHDEVSDLLEEDGLAYSFHKADEDRNSTRDYHTDVMGKFRCNNQNCSANGWSSKKIAIVIRLYRGNEYNARVYHQRCQKCDQVSRPTLDDSYAERIAYRLKKWNGVEVEAPQYAGNSKRPHQRHLCEGCKSGNCREGSLS